MADIAEISLPASPIVEFTNFHFNNSVLALFMVTGVVLVLCYLTKRSLQLVPSRFQVVMEGIVSFFYDQLKSAWKDDQRAKRVLPLMVALFLMIFIANQFSIIPLVSSIVIEGTQVLRTPTSDLSLPITLTVLLIVGSHIIAFVRHPIRHVANFIRIHLLFKVRSVKDLFSAFLEIFLGVMDIIGEFAKVISMSCRLFGNIFAGEVMVAVMTGLVSYFAPMPFIFLSIFSGIIQAFVFVILAINFTAGIIRSSEPAQAAH